MKCSDGLIGTGLFRIAGSFSFQPRPNVVSGIFTPFLCIVRIDVAVIDLVRSLKTALENFLS
jgi:hypothetical protein